MTAALALLLLVAVPDPGDAALPDPEGTWAVYLPGNAAPTWTLVVKSMSPGRGWETTWQHCQTGEDSGKGTLQRSGPGGFTEFWRGPHSHGTIGWRWLADGGAVADSGSAWGAMEWRRK